MRVADNGKGFALTAPQQVAANRGNGLKNMHTRAEAMKGKLTLESIEGKGTILLLQAPL